jgi:hypothetical protein
MKRERETNMNRMATLLTLLMGFAATHADANLIVNGSFENPAVAAGSYMENNIAGWTVVGGTVAVVSGTFSAECCVFPAEDGNQWVDLTGVTSNAVEGVEQAVSTTPGTLYTLSFYVGNVYDPTGIFGTTSTVDVKLGGINGTLLYVATNNSTTTGTQVWTQFTTTFTATASSTTLDFLNADPSNDNSNGLDNVVLTGNASASAPEPSAVGFLLIGLGLFVWMRKRVATSC